MLWNNLIANVSLLLYFYLIFVIIFLNLIKYVETLVSVWILLEGDNRAREQKDDKDNQSERGRSRRRKNKNEQSLIELCSVQRGNFLFRRRRRRRLPSNAINLFCQANNIR